MRALLVGLAPHLQRDLSLELGARDCLVDVARTHTEAMAFLSSTRHYQLLVVGEAAPTLGRLRALAPSANLVWARRGLKLAEAVDAVRAGALDVWEEAPDADRLADALIAHPLAASTRLPLPGLGDLVAESPAMRATLALLGQAAPSEAPVLLTGETGTGKNRLVRWLHQASARRHGPLVVVDCAGLPAGLAENELFGHARGAFTGADREAAGRFEAAQGGTLFLDEIGELGLGIQQKLLRFLEEGEVERLGEVKPRAVDARIVAATHRDLRALVADGRFREDLLYRLEVIDVPVPPLRERREDLPGLVRALLAAAGQGAARFTPAAEALLRAYSWPGNVRELRNVVDRALVLRPAVAAGQDPPLLDVELLPARLRAPAPEAHAEGRPLPASDPARPEGAEIFDLETAERERIVEALRRHSTLDEAAAALGIDPSTLWRKRKRLGLG